MVILWKTCLPGTDEWDLFESKVFAGLPRWLSGRESACQLRRFRRQGFDPWVGKIPWSRK